jgi:hypothetical protein
MHDVRRHVTGYLEKRDSRTGYLVCKSFTALLTIIQAMLGACFHGTDFTVNSDLMTL